MILHCRFYSSTQVTHPHALPAPIGWILPFSEIDEPLFRDQGFLTMEIDEPFLLGFLHHLPFCDHRIQPDMFLVLIKHTDKLHNLAGSFFLGS